MNVYRETTVSLDHAQHLHLAVDSKLNGVCVKAIKFNTDAPSDCLVFAANRTKDGRCYSNGQPMYELIDHPEIVALIASVTQAERRNQ